MNFCLKLTRNEIVVLPSENSLQERIELCDRLINEFPDYFYQYSSTTTGVVGSAKVCARLEAMANYILSAADNSKEYPVMTEYRQKLVKNNEIPFSTLEKKYDFNEKM